MLLKLYYAIYLNLIGSPNFGYSPITTIANIDSLTFDFFAHVAFLVQFKQYNGGFSLQSFFNLIHWNNIDSP